MAKLILALLGSVALAYNTAHAAPAFSTAEQQEMNRAVLLYNVKDSVGSAKFPACLALQGSIPTQAFLDSLGAAGKIYKAWPAGTARGTPPCESSFIVRRFLQTAPNRAEASVEQECGQLCGNRATISLQKTAAKWAVASMRYEIHY